MRRRNFIIAAVLLLPACSGEKSYWVWGKTYAVGEKNIAFLEWRVFTVQNPMDHGGGKILKSIYFPFVYTRANGVLKFERYCEPTKMVEPTSVSEEAAIQSVAAVEKNCNVQGIKLVSREEAGRPMGGDNIDGGISLSVNIISPETGKLTRKVIFFEQPSKPFWW